jgi:hypothetical protein
MANKYMKKCLTFLAIKEMQMKMTLRFHLILVRMITIKKTTNAGEGAGKKESLHILGKSVNVPQKTKK